MMLGIFHAALCLLTVPSSLSHPLTPLLRSSLITTQQLVAVSPASSSCIGTPEPLQCRTAAQAAPFITTSFAKYGISAPSEMAALVGTIAFESGDFKYNVNLNPSNVGQGTRNMQSFTFNQEYAQSIPELAGQLEGIAAGSDDQILGLLTANDDYDFGSAAWFLTTQCGDQVRQGLQTGGQAGWEQYVSECIGTSPTAGRQDYWERAVQAIGATN